MLAATCMIQIVYVIINVYNNYYDGISNIFQMHYFIFSMFDARQTVNMGNWGKAKKKKKLDKV